MGEKEQTFEELMAELDAEATGGKAGDASQPPKVVDLSGPADLDFDEPPSIPKTKESEPKKAEAKAAAPAAAQPAPTAVNPAQKVESGEEDAVLVDSQEELGGEHDFSQGADQENKGLKEVKHVLGNLWSKAKSKAEALTHEEGRGEAAAKVSAFWDKATDAIRTTATAVAAEAKATASDVAASARNMNSKILVKPNASFGVPLPLIAKRQGSDEESFVVPAVVDSVLSMLETHVAANGPLPLDLLTKPLAGPERESLYLLRDRIDNGEDVAMLQLEGDTRSLVGLLKLFLVELPEPLLTFALAEDFVKAATPGGAASMHDVAVLLPPTHFALCKRVLPFLLRTFAAVAKPTAPPTETLRRLAVAMGVLLLRTREKELRNTLLDAVPIRNAAVAVLQNCDEVFAHDTWFLRNWFGVYSLAALSTVPAAFAVDEEAGGEGEPKVEVVVDATGVTVGGEKAKDGSARDVGQWERKVNGPERVTMQMVVSLEVGKKPLRITFKGPTAKDGIEELIDILPPTPKPSKSGANKASPEPPAAGTADPRASPEPKSGAEAEVPAPNGRRLGGSYTGPLPWQAKVQAWGDAHTGLAWDEQVHPAQLQELWALSFPDKECPPRKDKAWSELGFQQQDPSTDFRGAGMLALEVLLHFAKQHTELYKTFLANSKGATPTDGYPFACGAINVTFMLLDSLLLLPSSMAHQGPEGSASEARMRRRGAQCRYKFGMMLESNSDDMAPFHQFFLVAIRILNKEWLASTRSYMYFNAVLDATKTKTSDSLRSARASTSQGWKAILEAEP
mmetsp:Transcript_18154/g.43767  ORF Transcript_18154/g.43767 Transcript_18154/m.43767 type:complete len:793 (-) Transcript_18154:196-2574(-)